MGSVPGFVNQAIPAAGKLEFDVGSTLRSFVISDLNMAKSTKVQFDGGNEMEFTSDLVFAFSLSGKCSVTNIRDIPLNLSIYTIPKDDCDSAMYFLGQPYVNVNLKANSNKFCVFSPNSDFLEEINFSISGENGDVTFYTFPLAESHNVTAKSSLYSRTTNPYYLKFAPVSASADVFIQKIHNGDIEWTWNRCIARSFGKAESTGLVEPDQNEIIPYCYSVQPIKGFTREDADIIGVCIPFAVFGIIVPYLGICGVFAPLIAYIREKFPAKNEELPDPPEDANKLLNSDEDDNNDDHTDHTNTNTSTKSTSSSSSSDISSETGDGTSSPEHDNVEI